MSVIVPRWEWRTFGPSFGSAEAALAELATGDAEESEELYLVAKDDANVKVRGGLMDIKLLREVDARGLERWEPVMKVGFPLRADDVAEVLDALGVSGAVASARSAYELDQLLDELVRPGGAVREARIEKRRTRFTVGGCTGEVTEVTADGRSTRSVAVESEDPDAVIDAVGRIGLGNYVNTSYPRGLARLLDDASPRYAVIDVGTNSVKFHVGERASDGSWRTIVDRAEITRLGEGLHETGMISDEALARTADAIGAMVDEARRLGVSGIATDATAGMRIARNGDEVVRAIHERSGVAVQVIEGEEEGRLAYLAVRTWLGVNDGTLVVFDSGGGSSQFTFGEGSNVVERFSLEVGAVTLTDRFGLDREVGEDALREALAAVSTDLSRLDDRPPPDVFVGMGGTVTSITAVMLGLATYDPDRVQGATLDRAEVDRQIELYRSRDAHARRAIVGLQPKRADVILAGACIVRTVMEKLGVGSLTVSDRGVRHGLLVDRFGG